MIDSNDDARMWEEFMKQQRKNDPLTRLSQKAIESRTDVKVILKDSGMNIEQIKEMMNKPFEIRVSEPMEIPNLREELAAASKYIEENEVIHMKVKKNVPTVIEYQGRRYVLDHDNHRR